MCDVVRVHSWHRCYPAHRSIRSGAGRIAGDLRESDTIYDSEPRAKSYKSHDEIVVVINLVVRRVVQLVTLVTMASCVVCVRAR
jgi:hypothetical protein